MKKMTSEECKEEMINILRYIDDICKKNNINYSLIGGSLIGAKRNGGIIPWDDDIDIGLIYSEYVRLIDILSKNNSDYIVINDELCDNYYLPHTKIVSKRTFLKERNFETIDEMGVFIDIFTYMYLPNNKNKRKRFYNKLRFHNIMISGLRKPTKKENYYFLRMVRYFICKKIIGKRKIYKCTKKLYSKYSKTNYIVSNSPQYGYEKEIQNSNFFEGYQRIRFEKIDVSISVNYDEFLRTSFGDYMTPPPIEKRITHELTAYWRDEK